MTQTRNEKVKKKTKPAKSFRLDDEAIFMIELYAKLDRQSGTSWVASAVDARATQTMERTGIRWTQYSHIVEGVSDCAMFKDPRFSWDTAGSRRKEFVLLHEPFFFDHASGAAHVMRIKYLWPRIDELVLHWETHAEEKGGARKTAELMWKILAEAGAPMPTWDQEAG